MTLNKKFTSLTLSLLMTASLLCAPKAMAGDAYVSADLRKTYVDETVDIEGTDISLDGNTTGARLAVGYSFNEYFAAELAYSDFGELNQSALGLEVTAEADAQELALLGSFPLGERFDLFGRLGYTWWDSETSIGTEAASISGNDVSFGAGLEFAAGENLSVVLSGSKYRLDDLDLAVFGIGIKFQF